MLLPWFLSLVVFLVSASTCVAGSADLETLWTFDDIALGKLPANFACPNQNGNRGPAWTVIESKKALNPPKVLAVGEHSRNTGHPTIILANEVTDDDFELSVSFVRATSKSGAGSGLIWRARDERNYYLLQLNPLGRNNMTLYRVVKGVRTQLDACARVDAVTRGFAQTEWHTLQVIVLGDRFVATFDGRDALDCRDQTFTKGRVGLWSSGSSLTYFDNLHLKKLK